MLAEALAANAPMVRLVSRSRSFEPAEPDSLDARLAVAPLRSVDAKKHIFTEGDHRSHLYRVESGTICLYKVLPDGRRQVLGFAYPGDLLGFGPSGDHRFNAQATRDARLRCLSWGAVHRAARQDPALAIGLVELIAQELAAAHDLLLTTGQRTATEKVAAFLLAISRRNQRRDADANVIHLPMTRADIGDLLALTLETVSRSLSKLRRLEIIDLEQSSLVQILDKERLEELAIGARDL